MSSKYGHAYFILLFNLSRARVLATTLSNLERQGISRAEEAVSFP
jgi:hypothetical protein